jgi:hypothetical protein
VACCYVEITGKDGEKHFLTTDAASAYAAVQHAIDAWAKFWWWDSTAIATVKRSEESWNIPVRKVIEKRAAQYRRHV